jgi:hypothetical protein
MRNYPVDSQNSMARVVVMVLMADGAIDPSELKLLERPDIIARMGFDHACLSACFKSLASGLFKGSAGGFVIGYDLDFCHVQAKQKEQQDAPPLPF